MNVIWNKFIELKKYNSQYESFFYFVQIDLPSCGEGFSHINTPIYFKQSRSKTRPKIPKLDCTPNDLETQSEFHNILKAPTTSYIILYASSTKATSNVAYNSLIQYCDAL